MLYHNDSPQTKCPLLAEQSRQTIHKICIVRCVYVARKDGLVVFSGSELCSLGIPSFPLAVKLCLQQLLGN